MPYLIGLAALVIGAFGIVSMMFLLDRVARLERRVAALAKLTGGPPSMPGPDNQDRPGGVEYRGHEPGDVLGTIPPQISPSGDM